MEGGNHDIQFFSLSSPSLLLRFIHGGDVVLWVKLPRKKDILVYRGALYSFRCGNVVSMGEEPSIVGGPLIDVVIPICGIRGDITHYLRDVYTRA